MYIFGKKKKSFNKQEERKEEGGKLGKASCEFFVSSLTLLCVHF